MLFVLLSLVLGDTRTGNLAPYQWPADKFKSAAIGASGTITWRDDGSAKNAALDCPGVDPTGMTYSDAGINACIQAAAPSGDVNGGVLFFPRGVYKLQNPINLTKRMVIYGEGMTNTWFYPDPGVTGLIVRYACEGGPCIASRGDLSVIRDIGFEYALNASPWVGNQGVGLGYVAYGSTGPSNFNLTQVFQVTTAGTTASTEPTWGSAGEGDFITDGTATWHAIEVACIRFNARATVRDVYCDRCSGNGILVEASTPFKNANSWNLDNVYVSQAQLNGMYVQGADSNAGTAYGLHSGSNRLWGVYDNSFLGNTYIGCSVEANGLGAYAMVGVSATNVLNGCYSEGGEPPSILAGNSMSLGGLHGAGFSDNSGAFRMSPGNRFETNGGGITFRDNTAPSGAHIDMPYASNYLMNLADTVEGGIGFTVQSGTGSGNAGWWKWRHANLDGRTMMSWGGINSDAGPGSIWFPAGFYLGDRIYLDARTAKPTWTGTPENPGSFRYNTALYSQNTSGFTPGTFGWQNQGAGSTPQIVTLRWPHYGFNNEANLTANPSGTPHVVDWKDEAGMLYTNMGATGKQYVTLPAAAFNPDLRFIEFSAYNDNTNGIRLAATTHAIQYGMQSTAGGGYLESTTPGSFIKLKMTGHTGTNGVWDVAEIGGTWTDGTSTFTPSGSRSVAKTANYTLTAGDTNTTFTNKSASGTVVFQLPAAAAGLRYRFAVDTAQAVIILNGAGDQITMDGVTFDTGSLPQLTNNAMVGSMLDIEAVDTDNWYVVGRSGRWELDTFTSVQFHRDVPPYETYLNPNAGKVLTIGATGELEWDTPSGASGAYVLKAGDTMSGNLGIAGTLGVTGTATMNGTLTCNNTVNLNGTSYVNGGPINFRGTNGQNILNLPTGETQGLVINDASGQWYSHFDTQNQTFNFDVVSGYNGDVYFNTGVTHWNAGSGSNIIAMPASLAEGLDIKDGAGNYYMVFNSSAQTIASGKPWSLSSNVGYAFPSYSPGGTTQTIDWNSGINASVDTSSASGNVTLTLSNPSLGARYVIILATGASARALTFPGSVLLVSPPTPGANQKYKYDLVWNGTNYFGHVDGPY